MSSKLKCEKTTFIKDNIIDMKSIRDFKIKLKDKKIYHNFINYKKYKTLYDKIRGFITRKSCSDFMKNSKSSKKDREKCNTYKKDEKKYFEDYMKSLSTEISKKIVTKFKKTLKYPKEKRMKRLSCYIQLLLDLSYKKCNKSTNVDNIINDIYNNYNTKEPLKKAASKAYLEYLLTNKSITNKELKLYKKFFKNDDTFIKSLETVINSYVECTSISRHQTRRYNNNNRYSNRYRTNRRQSSFI